MTDSEGYQSDSGGYQSPHQPGSAGHRWPADAHPALVKVIERATSDRGDQWAEARIDLWRHFADLVAPSYGDEILAVRLRDEGALQSERLTPRGLIADAAREDQVQLPKVEVRAESLQSRHALTVQVNVRLSESDHQRLAEVARRYGMAGTTLARLFIMRGLEAAEREGRG